MIHGSICSFGWRSELRTREDRQEQIELVQDGLAEDGERPLVPFAGLACKVNAAITDVQEAAQVVRVSAAEDVSAIKAWGKQEARVSMLTFIALACFPLLLLAMSFMPLRFRLFLLFPSCSLSLFFVCTCLCHFSGLLLFRGLSRSVLLSLFPSSQSGYSASETLEAKIRWRRNILAYSLIRGLPSQVRRRRFRKREVMNNETGKADGEEGAWNAFDPWHDGRRAAAVLMGLVMAIIRECQSPLRDAASSLTLCFGARNDAHLRQCVDELELEHEPAIRRGAARVARNQHVGCRQLDGYLRIL